MSQEQGCHKVMKIRKSQAKMNFFEKRPGKVMKVEQKCSYLESLRSQKLLNWAKNLHLSAI